MENMGNQNTDGNQNQGAGTNTDQNGEKLFTQEDVNRIVSDRLARAKNNQESGSAQEREASLNARELKLDAREQLAELGISKDLLPLVNCSSKDTMKESIDLIAAQFGSKNKSGSSGYRISTGTSNKSNGAGHDKGLSDDEIRAAMGLTKGK